MEQKGLREGIELPNTDIDIQESESIIVAENTGGRSQNGDYPMAALPKMERRFFPASEIRLEEVAGERVLSWYAAKFDVLSEDLGGFRERIGRRAFTKTLQEHDIRGLFNHNPNYVLGRSKAGTLELKVDLHGLFARATLPDTLWARDLAVSIERGDITSGSFGFNPIKDKWAETEDKLLVRDLVEVRLFDVSLVTFPAYPDAEGVSLRSLCDDV